MSDTITSAELEALRRYGTCTVANAIESFDVRLRSAGYTDGSIRVLTSREKAMTGYAVTMRMRSANPPAEGHLYTDRTDLWNYVWTLPAPRILVIENVDDRPDAGAFVGATHAVILLSLGCVGVITNGAARDLPAIEKLPFHLYAGAVVPSHGFSHIFDFGEPVTIAGLAISPGDLLHGDLHGVVNVPKELAVKIPAAAEAILERDRRIFELCRSKEFSVEKLREITRQKP
jgi:regulator of RNase E activity RraA